MSDSTAMQLVQTRQGRILFHVYMMLIDYKWNWHLKGIIREIKNA